MADVFTTLRIRAGEDGGSTAVDTEVDVLNAEGEVQSKLSATLDLLRADVDKAIEEESNRPPSNGLVTFKDSFTINAATLVLYNGLSALYTATANKSTIVTLPTDAAIAASNIPYPIRLEFTHIGGSSAGNDNLLLIQTQAGEDRITTRTNGVQTFVSLNRNTISVFEKTSIDSTWDESRFAANPSEFVLPGGLFRLRNDKVIANIEDVATELADLVPPILRGDAFLVTTGGDYFGTSIGNGDHIGAEIDDPDLTTASTDWAILRNTRNSVRVTNGQQLFLQNFTQDGIRFDGSRNIFVHEDNVIIETIEANNVPYTVNYVLAPNVDGDTAHIVDLAALWAPAFTFSDLLGGPLTVDIQTVQTDGTSTTGFTPEQRMLRIGWTLAGFTFDLPLTNLSVTDGRAFTFTELLNVDYSSIFNVAPDVLELHLTWRGLSFSGTLTLHSLINTREGPLHEPVVNLIDQRLTNATNALDARFSELQRGVGDNTAMFAGLEPRLNKLIQIVVEATDTVDVFFLSNPSGTSIAPATLAGFRATPVGQTDFVVFSSSGFLAVGTQHTHDYSITTTNDPSGVGPNTLSSAAANSDPRISVERSITADIDTSTGEPATTSTLPENRETRSFFIYSIDFTDLNISFQNVGRLRVTRTRTATVAETAHRVDLLTKAVADIMLMLRGNAMFNLAPEKQSWLTNDLSIRTEEVVSAFVPTRFNRSFSDDGSQVFFKQSSDAPLDLVTGMQPSTPINANVLGAISRRGRKLVYLALASQAQGSTLLIGSEPNARAILAYELGNVVTYRFVPAIPEGTHTEVGYPRPSLTQRHDWIFVRGQDPITFVGASTDVPLVDGFPPVPLTVSFEFQALTNARLLRDSNGVIIPPFTLTLDNIGGPNLKELRHAFVLPDQMPISGEPDRTATVNILIRYVPGINRILVGFTPDDFQTRPWLYDYQFRAQWTRQITTPSVPASRESVTLGPFVPNTVFPVMIGPSNTLRVNSDDSTIVIAGPNGEVDTGYSYNGAFGNNGTGTLIARQAPNTEGNSEFLDYQGADPHQTIVSQLVTQLSALDRGLFTEDYDEKVVAVFDTQMEAVTPNDTPVKLGSQLFLSSPAPDNTEFEVVINNDGVVSGNDK